MTKRNQPPSRARYAAAHPTIGLHVTRDVYTRLDALREVSGHSFGKLVQQMLGVVETDYESMRKRGYDAGAVEGRRAGYVEAARNYRVTYSCNVCGLPIAVRPGSHAARLVSEALAETGWGHRRCHQLRRLEGRRGAPQQ